MSMEVILFALVAIPSVLLITNTLFDKLVLRVWGWYNQRRNYRLYEYVDLSDVEL